MWDWSTHMWDWSTPMELELTSLVGQCSWNIVILHTCSFRIYLIWCFLLLSLLLFLINLGGCCFCFTWLSAVGLSDFEYFWTFYTCDAPFPEFIDFILLRRFCVTLGVWSTNWHNKPLVLSELMDCWRRWRSQFADSHFQSTRKWLSWLLSVSPGVQSSLSF